MKKRHVILAGTALALILTLRTGNALAYFTTYTQAEGSVTMEMGFTQTIPEEIIDSAGKHIMIRNTGEYSCFTRVKVFADIAIDYAPASGWRDGGDGYWYYDQILEAGALSEELLVTYDFPENTEENTTEEFNIIVVQECTPVVYDDAGNPAPDWNLVISSTQQ